MSLNLKIPQAEKIVPRITVIGAGGGGGNAVNNMIDSGLGNSANNSVAKDIKFIVANTDAQALDVSNCEVKIQLGESTTKGLGAGSHPDVGRSAAEESRDKIVQELQGSNMVFITAGLGGGTGTGASPVIAEIAKEIGILTVGVVTKPFQFEGSHRMRTAELGLRELQKTVDTLIVIPNQNLFLIADKNTTLSEAFKLADDVLHSGVKSITDLMLKPGVINLDFADVRSIITEMGKAMMGMGEASGENRAILAAEAAISNPLLDNASMEGARGVLINITGGQDMTLFEVDEAAEVIRREVDDDANIIFGTAFDADMDGKINVSVVATGIDLQESGGSRFRQSADSQFSNNSTGSQNFEAQNLHRNIAEASQSFGEVSSSLSGGNARNNTGQMGQNQKPSFEKSPFEKSYLGKQEGDVADVPSDYKDGYVDNGEFQSSQFDGSELQSSKLEQANRNQGSRGQANRRQLNMQQQLGVQMQDIQNTLSDADSLGASSSASVTGEAGKAVNGAINEAGSSFVPREAVVPSGGESFSFGGQSSEVSEYFYENSDKNQPQEGFRSSFLNNSLRQKGVAREVASGVVSGGSAFGRASYDAGNIATSDVKNMGDRNSNQFYAGSPSSSSSSASFGDVSDGVASGNVASNNARASEENKGKKSAGNIFNNFFGGSMQSAVARKVGKSSEKTTQPKNATDSQNQNLSVGASSGANYGTNHTDSKHIQQKDNYEIPTFLRRKSSNQPS